MPTIFPTCKRCKKVDKELMDLVKFICKRARQHIHDYKLSAKSYQAANPGSMSYKMWAYEFLHDEAVMYIKEINLIKENK